MLEYAWNELLFHRVLMQKCWYLFQMATPQRGEESMPSQGQHASLFIWQFIIKGIDGVALSFTKEKWFMKLISANLQAVICMWDNYNIKILFSPVSLIKTNTILT